jgi:hypothetical protein
VADGCEVLHAGVVVVVKVGLGTQEEVDDLHMVAQAAEQRSRRVSELANQFEERASSQAHQCLHASLGTMVKVDQWNRTEGHTRGVSRGVMGCSRKSI